MLIPASANVRQCFTEVTFQTSCVSCLSSSEYFESKGLDPLPKKQCILRVPFCCLFAYSSVFFSPRLLKSSFFSFPVPRSLTLPCLSKTIKQEQANVNPADRLLPQLWLRLQSRIAIVFAKREFKSLSTWEGWVSPLRPHWALSAGE